MPAAQRKNRIFAMRNPLACEHEAISQRVSRIYSVTKGRYAFAFLFYYVLAGPNGTETPRGVRM